VVDAVEVVVVEVAVELPLQAGVAGMEVAGEGGSPALVEDRLVERFDVPVRLRAAGVDMRDRCAEPLDRGVEALAAKLVAVVGEGAFQPPAGGLQLAGDTTREQGCLRRGRVALLADDELGPGIGGVEIDRRQLPDRTRGPTQAAEVEAVDADQLAGMVDLDVRLRGGLARRLVGRPVAGDQREPLGARVEPVPAAPTSGRAGSARASVCNDRSPRRNSVRERL
jgi:hypothetical protein